MNLLLGLVELLEDIPDLDLNISKKAEACDCFA
jgi:hypothetical protein